MKNLISHDGAAIQANQHGAHYLDIFSVQTENVRDTLSFAITQADASEPAIRVLGAALSREARAHGPPLLKQIPARSPPSASSSFLA
ncbi:MAG: hypothetical protein DMG65_01695 [Candidatus Angelobacter sp. Gp1-AA117]|nr:MAG: hypothetical protein DMG65_01695 [Candidatus Angelobacter sp. Gp1-AA117]